jgi:8-oxo-dGTP pyrophosphatase MutT (NUDIX family)
VSACAPGAQTAFRRPEEVAVVVHRPGADGGRFLVLLRSPDRHGYWHLVAGALEEGESAAAAARRELREETGLDAPVADLGIALSYALAGEPAELRVRFPPGTERIRVHAFVAAAPTGWEPELDDEHVDHRWLPADEAVALLAYPEPREAVRAAAKRTGAAR